MFAKARVAKRMKIVHVVDEMFAKVATALVDTVCCHRWFGVLLLLLLLTQSRLNLNEQLTVMAQDGQKTMFWHKQM